MKWSLVCPVWHNDIDLIPRTLPSFLNVNPTEIIICIDYTHTEIPNYVELADKVVDKVKNIAGNKVKILKVKRNDEYTFQQAWIRRAGFLKAKYDRVLTTDADLVINKNVLKAIALVGNNDIGLVSVSKLEPPKDLLSFLRFFGKGILQKYLHPFANAYRGYGIATSTFTGLYAIWRPYWLDSEDEGIKKLVNPKQKLRGETKEWGIYDFYGVGEDTYLRDCMERKHRVVYLHDIGAKILTNPLEAHPDVQYSKGIYFALRGRSLVGALTRTVFRLEPYYLCGHFYGKRLLRLLSRRTKLSYSLDKASEYWQHAPSSIGRVKVTSEKLVQWSDGDVKKIIEKSIEYRNMKEGAMVYRNKVSSWIKRENIRNILDFGCGLGQDGVYFSKLHGIHVTFADIVPSNIKLTERYSKIWGIPTKAVYIDNPKTFQFPEVYDMIFANGVLHHTPEAKEIAQNLEKFLKPKGFFVCMLYTKKHFKATGAKTIEEYALLSEGAAPVSNPYSDYYDLEKAEKLFEGFKLVETFETHKGKFGWYVWKK